MIPMESQAPFQYIWNFVTGEYEATNRPLADLSTDELRAYLPQDETVQNLYGLYLDTGKDKLDAYGDTLKAFVGERPASSE
jgi:hypothetical protein